MGYKLYAGYKGTRGVGAHLKIARGVGRALWVVVVEGKPEPGDAEGPRRRRAYSVSARQRHVLKEIVKNRSNLCSEWASAAPHDARRVGEEIRHLPFADVGVKSMTSCLGLVLCFWTQVLEAKG